MGVSRYNAEGYYDPTAYEGIRNASAVAPKDKITYPTGCMKLRADGCRDCISKFNEARHLCQLATRNIELFISGRDC